MWTADPRIGTADLDYLTESLHIGILAAPITDVRDTAERQAAGRV
jgi:hypothetical protein